MELLHAVLLILLVFHILLFVYIKRNKWIRDKGLVPYGPAIMIKTKVGFGLIDRLAKYRRFWRVCGVLSRIVTLFLMIWIVAILAIDVIAIPRLFGQAGLGIEYALAIPGLNPMLPLVYGWIGLIVAMVIHELAHGIQSKSNDIDVKSTGILWGVVPLGAFVEPDDEQIEKSTRRIKLDIFAAGITTNFIAAMILFMLVFAGMTACVSSDYGDRTAIYAISADSPGIDYGIPTTSIIIELDGNDISTFDDFQAYLDLNGCKEYEIKYIYHDEEFVKSAIRLGAYINSVVKDSPASRAGLTGGCFLISIDGHSFGTHTAFSDFMKGTHPGQVIHVDYLSKSGSLVTDVEVTLTDNNGIGYLGVTTSTSGYAFSTPNTVRSTGIDPFFGCNTITEYAMSALSYISNAFNGFSPVPESTHWWYHTNGIPADAFWILMSIAFWTMWLNLVLGVTNAIPAMPFDGGFIFVGGLDFIFEKFGMSAEKRERRVAVIGNFASYLFIMILVLVLLVIIL